MTYKDPIKRKEQQKGWNKRYYERHKKQEIERTTKRKNELKKWLSDYKNTLNCSTCGENDKRCLEFHHKRKDKKSFQISEAIVRKGYSKEKIMKEAEKCIILCANCHRKIHSVRETS